MFFLLNDLAGVGQCGTNIFFCDFVLSNNFIDVHSSS